MTRPSVPFFDLRPLHGPGREEILAAVARVADAGSYMSEAEVSAFEVEFAAYCGVCDCVAAGSGTDALGLVLAGMGAGRPDLVLAAPTASPVVADAVLQAGPRLGFVDADPATGLLDLQKLEARLKATDLLRPLAVVATHLCGLVGDMDGLLGLAAKHEFIVIEDARQAHGSLNKGRKAGSFGFAAAFSFSPEKNLAALGQAGAVTTCDQQLARAVRQVRDQGLAVGFSGRVEMADSQMDAVQAAVLRLRLPALAEANERRRAVAAAYDKAFAGTGFTEPQPVPMHCLPNRHLYAIRVPDREDMRAYLDDQGVCTGVHYPVPLHLHPRFRRLGFGRGDFPGAEEFARVVLSLPVHPGLTEGQIAHVIDCVRDFGGSMR